MSDVDPLVGQVIEGRYRVLAVLGRGGMGAVYRVEHVALKKEMALKLLLPELGRSDELVRRFEREAEAAARLSHTNIVVVTDFGRTADGQLFLVMELLSGPSLAQVLKGGALPLERALRIQRQILRALDHAHAAGIVHRDLKPDNIVLVDRDGETDVVKLLDFGIAKLTAGEDEPKEALTQAGLIYGTPEYLSPEQALGEPIDRRADLYAGGVILYEMLAGRRPFVSESRLEIVSMHVTKEAIPLSDVVATVPRGVSDAIDRALKKRRDDRWPDAASFLAALGPSTTSAMPVATSVPLFSRVETLLASRGVPAPRLAAWGLAVGVALVVIGGLGLALRRPTPATAVAPLVVDAVELARSEKTLRSARTCRERRVAAIDLINAHDKRYLGSLQAARERRGGFLGLERSNACMTRELDAAIHKLEDAP